MRFSYIIFILILTASAANSKSPDEGMYPLNEIEKINFKDKVLTIDVKEIYNSNNLSLIDAIVKIGGCTGSFVSADGLIITNHHCAYRAAQAASDKDHDYIKNGFIARNRSEEIEAKGYTIRITQSYKDVSKEVLSVVKDGMSPADGAKHLIKNARSWSRRLKKKIRTLKPKWLKCLPVKVMFYS